MRFRNLDGSGPQPFGNVFRWSVVDRILGRRRRSPANAAVPTVKPDPATLAVPPAPGEPARLVWIGHASFLVQLDGISLLIDPVLFAGIGPLASVRRNVAAAIDAGSLPRIDATLVSHNHYDHLDLPSVRAAGAPVVTGTGIGSIVRDAVPALHELGWWESTTIGAVRIHFVPSQHWSRRGLADANETLWGGFVVEGSTARLYHSGDTAYFDGFAEIGRRFPGIDAAMLPIGAYDPEWFMSRQHMGPEDATRAFLDLGAATFVAMHWGTFKLTDEPLDEPPIRLAAAWAERGLDPARCRILPIGGALEVARP